MKRLLDVVFSLMVLILASPVILLFIVLVWLQDFKSPFYMAPRVGKNGRLLKMAKLRSMVSNADKTGVNSTSANDNRITRVGHIIRRYKLDEVTQFWNVLIGSMSVVGPRPQVKADVDMYTLEEQRLLSVRPGITDMASIVFSDEGDILKDSLDPDLDYNQLIRPWKSRLGLFCIDHSSITLDLRLITLTATAILDRDKALKGVNSLLISMGASDELVRAASRVDPLIPTPPPGASEIVATTKQA